MDGAVRSFALNVEIVAKGMVSFGAIFFCFFGSFSFVGFSFDGLFFVFAFG